MDNETLNRIAQNEKDIIMLKTTVYGENGIQGILKDIREAHKETDKEFKSAVKIQNMMIGGLIIINIFFGVVVAIGLKLL